MARPLTVFRFSEGLRFTSMLGTLCGLGAAGYGVYTAAYYRYLTTAEVKRTQSTAGNS